MLVPTEPKIYHIAHVDRLPSIIADGSLWCDAEMSGRTGTGTTIGMNNIKQARLTKTLQRLPGLHVGDCVPFYFCPRSVMLYVIHMANSPELAYRDGQGSILHLEADLRQTVDWAKKNNRRWAFTSCNARASYGENWSDLRRLDKLDWDAIQSHTWSGPGVDGAVKEGKQAEFLLEHSFPWELVTGIGVHSTGIRRKVLGELQVARHQPPVEIKPDWYY